MKLSRWIAALAAIALWCVPAKAQDFVQSYNFVNTGTNGPTTSFANSGVTSFFISWSPQVSLSACSIQVDSSSDGSSWGSGDLIASTSCTTAGSSATATLGAGKNFVRIHVTALTGNGGLNVTMKGWGGGGGGITQVGSLPTTPCTNNATAQLTVAPFGIYTCIQGVWSLSAPSSAKTFYAVNYGVKADSHFLCDATTVNTQNTVSIGASDPSFLKTAVPGQIVWVSNATCQSNLTSPVTLNIAQTTITTVDSATQIHVGANAGSSCAGTCIVVWGDDDTAALQTWYTALTSDFACGNGILPSGGMIVQAAINNPASICGSTTTTASTGAGQTISGQGANATWLFPSPNFVATNCAAGGAVACFFGDGNGQSLKDFGLMGSGVDPGTLPATNYNVFTVGNTGTFGAAAVVRNVWVWQWAAGVSKNGTIFNLQFNGNGLADGLTCFLVQQCIELRANVLGGTSQSFNSITNSQLQGRNSAIVIDSSSGANVPVQLSNNLIGQAFSNNSLKINTGNITVEGTNNIYSNIAGATAQSIINNATSTINSVNESVPCSTTTTNCITNPGTMRFTNLTASTGGASALINNTGKIYDECGNSFTGTTLYTGAGTVTGSCSVNGPIVVGNLVPSANWGTGAAVSAPTGNTQNFTFTLTNGSAAVGASPTITFTFPAPAFLVAPARCSLWQQGGTQAVTATTAILPSTSITATSVVFTYPATPTINLTEFYQGSCSN